MANPATPTGFYAQQGNGQVYLSWNNAAGAAHYQIQRSTDGVTYTNYALVTPNSYFDTAVTIGTTYFYQVQSVNGSNVSNFAGPQSVVPTMSGQQSLGEIRLMAQQRADRVNSNYVTVPEWNSYIRLAQYELYDLLIDQDQMRYVAPTAQFTTNGSTYLYPLPDGILSFTNSTGGSFVPPPFYKLVGVDMGLANADQAWVTVTQFNFIDRNKFLYPNSASTIYGVFNCQYRLNDKFIQFIPVPSGNQPFRLWYIPRLAVPLADSDLVDGVSGWTQYVIVRAAKYALDKEESDTTKLDAELQFLISRIESAAKTRDVGQADTISDTRTNMGGFNGGWGRGPIGGW
jgi:hypothetical protein